MKDSSKAIVACLPRTAYKLIFEDALTQHGRENSMCFKGRGEAPSQPVRFWLLRVTPKLTSTAYFL